MQLETLQFVQLSFTPRVIRPKARNRWRGSAMPASIALLPTIILSFLSFGQAAVAQLSLGSSGSPTVNLDAGVFTGSTSGVTKRFLGIPFAKPP